MLRKEVREEQSFVHGRRTPDGKTEGIGLESNRIQAEKDKTGQNIAETYHLLSKKQTKKLEDKQVYLRYHQTQAKTTTTKLNQKHTLTLRRSPRKRCCVEQKVHRKKNNQLFFANVLCLVVMCREKIARISFFKTTQLNNIRITLSSHSISLLSNTHTHKSFFYYLFGSGRQPEGMASITGCVFIILINNGKNSYYYTLEYMKQRLFGKREREIARRKLGAAAEQENMSKR